MALDDLQQSVLYASCLTAWIHMAPAYALGIVPLQCGILIYSSVKNTREYDSVSVKSNDSDLCESVDIDLEDGLGLTRAAEETLGSALSVENTCRNTNKGNDSCQKPLDPVAFEATVKNAMRMNERD
jgi:hypothetical protein